MKIDIELDELWAALEKARPTNGTLCAIMRDVPYLKKRAWQLLLEGKPSRDELVFVMVHAEEFRQDAWMLLLTKGMNHEHLLQIIEHTGHPYIDMAWEQLIKMGPTRHDLRFISYHGKGHLKEEAKKLLDKLEDKQLQEDLLAKILELNQT